MLIAHFDIFVSQFSFAISSSSYEIYDYCWMSVQRGMIINYMVPTSLLIIATTVLGTLTLRSVVSRQRQVMVESIENILEKCHHIDSLNANFVSTDANIGPECTTTFKCCDEMEKVIVRFRLIRYLKLILDYRFSCSPTPRTSSNRSTSMIRNSIWARCQLRTYHCRAPAILRITPSLREP